jgi:probable regulatory domain-containing protein
MVIEIKPVEEDVDSKAIRIFLKTIELLGGPRKLVEYRNLTWLPSLMAASYAIVYNKEKGYLADRIASILGMSKNTVQNILRADVEVAKKKISEALEEKDEEKKTHMAGALAKIAYEEIKAGKDEINISLAVSKETAKSLGAEWAVYVLEKLKGTDFPIDKETLKSRLSGIKIKGKDAEEIIESLEFPISTPAELLHKIKEKLG